MIPDSKYRKKKNRTIKQNNVYGGWKKDDRGKRLHPEFLRKPFGLKY